MTLRERFAADHPRSEPVSRFSKILIANRGEIACRIMRTAKALGYRTVAVFSDADADALHVRQADDGGAHRAAAGARQLPEHRRPARRRKRAGADAVHPGYGFLSENAAFAEACAAAGPRLHRPAARGDRRHGQQGARQGADAGGRRPVRAGLSGARINRTNTMPAEAARIGFPLMVKAAAGGGGRGMRLVARRARSRQCVGEGAIRSSGAPSDPTS